MISNWYWNYHPDFFFGFWAIWCVINVQWLRLRIGLLEKRSFLDFFLENVDLTYCGLNSNSNLRSLQKCTYLTHFLLKLLNIFKITLLPNHITKNAHSRAAVPPQPPEQHVHGAPHNSRPGRSFEFFSQNELLNLILYQKWDRKSTFIKCHENPFLWRKKSPGTHFEIRTLKGGLKMRYKKKSGLTSWKSLMRKGIFLDFVWYRVSQTGYF